tara:strand:- start:31 stop:426 length:396 start_codon:yes stop_codon:yes gene_type:complete
MKIFNFYFNTIGLKNIELRKYIIALLIIAPLFLNPLKINNFENNNSKFKFFVFETINNSKFKFFVFETIIIHYNNLIEIENYLERNNYDSKIFFISIVIVYLILHFIWALVLFSFWFYIINYIYEKFLIKL